MKNLVVIPAVVMLAWVPTETLAKTKPFNDNAFGHGKSRDQQYKIVLQNCRKKFGSNGGSVWAEWGTHYGQTHWWCGHRDL